MADHVVERRKVIVVFVAGKRYAGKDTVSERMWEVLELGAGVEKAYVSVSDMCKAEYAAVSNLDLARLKGDRAYKEAHRTELTGFYKEITERHGVEVYVESLLAELVPGGPTKGPLVVCVVGIRRRNTVRYLEDQLGRDALVSIRLTTPDAVRTARGWVFDGAKDMDVTETDLDGDDLTWSATFPNDEDGTDAIDAWVDSTVLPLIQAALLHA